MLNRFRDRLAMASAFAFFVLATAPAYAAGSNMPWEQPLTQILDSIQGPVAKVVSVIVIITTGLTLAFGETSGGFRRLIQIVFGLSIAFAASSLRIPTQGGQAFRFDRGHPSDLMPATIPI